MYIYIYIYIYAAHRDQSKCDMLFVSCLFIPVMSTCLQLSEVHFTIAQFRVRPVEKCWNCGTMSIVEMGCQFVNSYLLQLPYCTKCLK